MRRKDVAKDLSGRRPGFHVISQKITPDQGDPVIEMVKFKLQMDEAFSPAWTDTRVVVNADNPDGSINLDVFFYPESQDKMANPNFVGRMQRGVDRALASGVDADGQFALAKDVLGRVARMDQRSRTIMKNSGASIKAATKTFGDVFRQMDVGDPPAYTFDFNEAGEIVPIDPKGRYVVALTSAGKTGTVPLIPPGADPKIAKAGTKTREQAFRDFFTEFEPVYNGPDDDQIAFGVYKMDNGAEASLDLNFFTDDLEEAQRVAAATNQEAIFDSQEMDVVETIGGLKNSDSPLKSADDVQRFLDTTKGLPSDAPVGITAGSVGQAGKNILTRNPAQLASETADMFMESRLGGSVSRALGMFTPPSQQTIRGTDAYEEMLKENYATMDDLMVDGDRPFWLSDEENDRLFNTTFNDGESVGSYALRLKDELTQEASAIDDAGAYWNPVETKEQALSVTDDPDVKKIIGKWYGLGLDPRKDIRRNINMAIQERLAKESGIDVQKRGIYRKLKAAWGEVALTSPRYVLANLSTNVLDSMITGHFDFGSGRDVLKYMQADIKGMPVEDIAANTKWSELAKEFGFGDLTGGISTTSGARAMIETTKRGSQTRAILDKMKLGSLAKVVETPLALAQAIDTNARVAMFSDVMKRVVEERRSELLSKLDSLAMAAKVDTTGMEMLPNFDPSYIYGHYRSNGFSEGYAQRAARNVAEVRNAARSEAMKEIDRVFLNYRKTNLDEAVGKIVPFHYWASRKLRFYAEEAYRNPVLAAQYNRALQGIENAQDDPGLNARQKGFLRIMSGPTGFSLLMNPDALMGVIKATGLDSGYSPENESDIGGVLRVLKSNGVGLYPWIDGALNMMGVYGDTFEPDMLGIRHRAIVGSVVNWMRSEGLLGEENQNPGAAPYADAMLTARENVSSWVSSFTPDWISQPVQKRARGSVAAGTLDDVIETRIIEENPQLTNLELARIMNDPDSEEYKSAYEDAARAGVIQQLLSFSYPVSFRVESDKRDRDRAARAEISKEAKSLGVNPWEVNNGNASLEFRANYEKQTGTTFAPADWESLSLKQDLRNADPQARRFVVLENEYQNIIPDNLRPVIDAFWGIKDGRVSPPGVDTDLSTQPQQVRDWYADRYLQSQGQQDNVYTYLNLQTQFKASNPDFGQFKDWQGKMYTLQAAYGGSLDEYRRVISNQNPAASRYFDDQLRFIRDRGVPSSQWSSEMDRVTLNSNAWYAIHGQPKTEYDPAATSDVGPGDVMPEMVAPYQEGVQYNVNQQPGVPSTDWVSVYNSRR
jgi:hypothetical protein